MRFRRYLLLFCNEFIMPAIAGIHDSSIDGNLLVFELLAFLLPANPTISLPFLSRDSLQTLLRLLDTSDSAVLRCGFPSFFE